MSRRLVYLPSAEFDLAAIYDLLAADSPRAALDFIADIRERCEPLADFPLMGRALDDTVHRISFDRRVTVFYAFDKATVWISAIRYRGRRFP